MNNPAGPGCEARLRARIDVLTDERDQARGRLVVRQLRNRRGTKRCVYCGDFAGLSKACLSHRDLLSLDPYYCLRPNVVERVAA